MDPPTEPAPSRRGLRALDWLNRFVADLRTGRFDVGGGFAGAAAGVAVPIRTVASGALVGHWGYGAGFLALAAAAAAAATALTMLVVAIPRRTARPRPRRSPHERAPFARRSQPRARRLGAGRPP